MTWFPSPGPRVPRRTCRPALEVLEPRHLSSSAPLLLPEAAGSADPPRLLVASDKGGTLYPLDIGIADSAWSPPAGTGSQGGAVGSGVSARSGTVAPALKIALVRGPFRVLPRHGWLRQRVTLRNEGSGTIQGPLTLVLDQLPGDVRLHRRRGFRVRRTSQGKAYRLVSVPLLRPGQGVTVVLVFTAPGRRSVPYRLRVE